MTEREAGVGIARGDFRPLYLSRGVLAPESGVPLPDPLAENVTTDDICPIQAVLILDSGEMSEATFTGFEWWREANPSFQTGEFNTIVAGASFGIGSSRENPAEMLAYKGVRYIFAPSFGGIFKKNAINNGIIPSTNMELLAKIAQEGYTPTEEELLEGLSEGQRRILARGGLFPYLAAIGAGEEPRPQDLIDERRSPKTTTEKIFSKLAGRALEKGDSAVVTVHDIIAYDVFVAHMQRLMKEKGISASFDPSHLHFFTDHFGSATSENAQRAVGTVRRLWAEEPRIFRGDSGVYNKVMVPRLKPGSVVLNMDSHSPELAVGWHVVLPAGYSEGAGAWANEGKVLITTPESLKMTLTGELPEWAEAKDVVWTLMKREFSGKAGDGKFFEIGGEGYAGLSYDQASLVFNAIPEWGGLSGFPTEYNREVHEHMQRAPGTVWKDVTEVDIRSIIQNVQSDAEAQPSTTVEFDLSDVEPLIAGPKTHKKVQSVNEFPKEVQFDSVLFVSCGGTTKEQLLILEEILQGEAPVTPIKIHLTDPVVGHLLQPVLARLVAQGNGKISIASEYSCGTCLGGGPFALQGGETVLSTSNRNGPGRLEEDSGLSREAGVEPAAVYLASASIAALTAKFGRVPTSDEVRATGALVKTAKTRARARA